MVNGALHENESRRGRSGDAGGPGVARYRLACGRAGTLRRDNRGITYVWTLVVVALIGLGLAAIGQMWHAMAQREKERELLFAGEQIQRAIGRYYENTPGSAQRFPRKLEDLLRDERYPTLFRYLRRVYVEPITGTMRWGLVEYPGVGITGVYSLSGLQPMKKANFPPQFTHFASAAKYSDWKFVYVPQQPESPTSPRTPGAQGTLGIPLGTPGAPASGEPIPTLKP